ncbi:MAG: carboxyl transferase domain-containing protein [Cytophagales bacterium]|nr:carboxyl transferase domain-containing protein [Cytophagales bacterium]
MSKSEVNIREDLQGLNERKALTFDINRPEAVEKRHQKGLRTARENVADLCDIDTFVEYGALAIAAQTTRKSRKELREQTPADGLVTGIGAINGELFGKEAANCVVLSYDYTVLAGTQGAFNHKKTDRMMQVAKASKKPIVFFVEGGGGRPGDTDFYPISVGGLDLSTFTEYAGLSGKVPRIAIVSGYCFAGNASIAGSSDVIIATENTSIGMGGPAMIEGGGLGVYHPKEIGPAQEQALNGTIDVLVQDEKEAVEVAKKYLSYFQGDTKDWSIGDQRGLRELLPEDRRYGYDVKKVIHLLADEGTVLELRSLFARNVVTALARIEGKPVGIIANSTRHLGGAIDSDASDKLSRFMQLCDAFGLPIVSLCDAPGFMVGPQIEKTAMVRHANRLFITAASLQVPIFTVVLRKAYGLGAMAMAGGSLWKSFFTISWPSGEFGAMGLEGAVKLGFKKELEACPTDEEREALYEKLVNEAYAKGKAINAAPMLEFDEVIDPADTRKYLITGLNSAEIKRNERMIDSW